ncbi:hypothetical protein AAU61_03825 [Desulfocarbo indianensis]|nr:hypothetical protein AAU61_03825 [Desulfocarbo indianensis]
MLKCSTFRIFWENPSNFAKNLLRILIASAFSLSIAGVAGAADFCGRAEAPAPNGEGIIFSEWRMDLTHTGGTVFIGHRVRKSGVRDCSEALGAALFMGEIVDDGDRRLSIGGLTVIQGSTKCGGTYTTTPAKGEFSTELKLLEDNTLRYEGCVATWTDADDNKTCLITGIDLHPCTCDDDVAWLWATIESKASIFEAPVSNAPPDSPAVSGRIND